MTTDLPRTRAALTAFEAHERTVDAITTPDEAAAFFAREADLHAEVVFAFAAETNAYNPPEKVRELLDSVAGFRWLRETFRAGEAA